MECRTHLPLTDCLQTQELVAIGTLSVLPFCNVSFPQENQRNKLAITTRRKPSNFRHTTPKQITLLPRAVSRTPQELMRFRGRFSEVDDRNDVRALTICVVRELLIEECSIKVAGYPAGTLKFIHLGFKKTRKIERTWCKLSKNKFSI